MRVSARPSREQLGSRQWSQQLWIRYHGVVLSLLVHTPVARIERNIQFEYVNARLAQESPLPVLGVLKHQTRDFSFRDLAFRSHTPNLELRRRGRDIRIEP